jgi:hypothetical protein
LQVRALHAITFVQAAEENLTQAWERLNGYFQQGLDLGFAKELIVQTFYLVLNKKSMVQLDATSGGCFSKLSVEQGMKIMQSIMDAEALYMAWADYDEETEQKSTPMKAEALVQATPNPTIQPFPPTSQNMSMKKEHREVKEAQKSADRSTPADAQAIPS